GERPRTALGHARFPAWRRDSWPGGQLEAPGDQILPGSVDAGIGSSATANSQGQPADVREVPAQRPVLACQPDRPPGPAEYLPFADDNRLEPAGHGEQMLYRPVLVMDIRRAGQLAEREARVPGEQLADGRHATVEPVHLGVDLDPVASADHERARDVLGLVH